ncbi:hypothetical protein CDCA_CDCA05G1447 [Cyanidium caldarium]|uniref:Elongator complex protein 4 n=1 Tax=Cyanidium caldarium TaxID=2771 RepID=A0AAV9ISW6_CYACA|nr:hypothetical protein CDCA_CDCA05G1447 [Cyanidium caldarium]
MSFVRRAPDKQQVNAIRPHALHASTTPFLLPLGGGHSDTSGRRCERYALRLAPGTVCALVEDEPTRYALEFQNMFVAQQLAVDNAVALLPGSLVREVPLSTRTAVERYSAEAVERFRVAWRYGQREPERAASKTSTEEEVSPLDLSLREEPRTLMERSTELALLDEPAQLLPWLQRARRGRRACVAVRSLQRWFLDLDGHGRDNADESRCVRRLWAYCHHLRALCRQGGATVLLTLPRWWCLRPELQHVLDHLIDVNSFGGGGTAHLGLGEYHGVLYTVLAPRLPGALRPWEAMPTANASGDTARTSMWVFRWARRQFVVERAHSVPEADKEKTATAVDW